jgi:membrane protein YqaA with SNARE-associated domain
LKQFFVRIVTYWKIVVLPALAKLGFWGAGAVALLDSSSIPVPMDAYLALSMWHDKQRFLLYVVLASTGSAIGGLVPYLLGRAGGELFLLKRINREKFEALRNRFERQEFLAVMIPSMLPPPAPWKVFIFASGVFEMRVLPLLVLKLGPGAADIVAHHAITAIMAIGVAAVIGFAWWWMRKKRAGTLMPG